MKPELLFSLLLAHLLADFVFQSNKLVELRNSDEKKIRLTSNLKHASRYFVLSILCILFFFSYFGAALALLALTVSLFHFVVDFSKSAVFAKWPSQKHNFLFFVVDQILHISSIILSLYLFFELFSTTKLLKITLISELVNFINLFLGNLSYNQKILISLCLVVTALPAVGIGIKAFFDYLRCKTNKSTLKQGFDVSKIFTPRQVKLEGGYIIGMLERLFIICAIVLKMEQIIGFMLATKSIARFKKFDDDYFVESFIIGSLISFISAIIIGIIIRSLEIIPY